MEKAPRLVAFRQHDADGVMTDDAPAGYKAVAYVMRSGEHSCAGCDLNGAGQGCNATLLDSGRLPCISGQRQDGMTVVFKKL